MSKDMEPIRSRRQLREQSAQTDGAAETPQAPISPAPTKPEKSTAPAPAGADDAADLAAGVLPGETAETGATAADTRGDVTAPKGERQSQTRARDRAALRAYKELIDPPGLSPLPSRRALRQAQLDAERAPITSVNPVVSAAPARPANAPASQPGSPPPAPASAPAAGRAPAGSVRAPAVEPVSAEGASSARSRVGRRAAATPAIQGAAEGQLAADPAQQVAATSSTAATAAKSEDDGTAEDESPASSHEQGTAPAAVEEAAQASTEAVAPDPVATAAHYPPLPGLVPGGSYYPVSAGPPAAAVAPTTEELRVLAAQRAEAERASVLAERAQARERLAQESAKSRRPSADPTATSNLAMVTPLEFIEVPGASRPILRPPTTTHIPIVARPSGSRPHRSVPASKRTPPAQGGGASAQPTAGQSHVEAAGDKPRTTVPSVSAERFDAALAARAVHRPGPGNRPLTGGRSSTLKQAEAMATGGHPTVRPVVEAVEVQRSQMPPMPADYAHGLEPLDAMTAGLGRTQRNLLIQWASIIGGGAAIVVCAILIITTMTR